MYEHYLYIFFNQVTLMRFGNTQGGSVTLMMFIATYID